MLRANELKAEEPVRFSAREVSLTLRKDSEAAEVELEVEEVEADEGRTTVEEDRRAGLRREDVKASLRDARLHAEASEFV